MRHFFAAWWWFESFILDHRLIFKSCVRRLIFFFLWRGLFLNLWLSLVSIDLQMIWKIVNFFVCPLLRPRKDSFLLLGHLYLCRFLQTTPNNIISSINISFKGIFLSRLLSELLLINAGLNLQSLWLMDILPLNNLPLLLLLLLLLWVQLLIRLHVFQRCRLFVLCGYLLRGMLIVDHF